MTYLIYTMYMGYGSMTLGRKAYMAYIAEGLADIQDWDGVLTYQCKNGSLFNSPSATAALAIHGHNANALNYLEFLMNNLGSSGVHCKKKEKKTVDDATS
jgi:ent-kaurene synthase